MIRVFGHAKQNRTLSKIQQNTAKNSQEYTLLEQALHFEKERNKDLQNRLQVQEQQIFDLLATIKELSQGIKCLEAPKPEPLPQKRKKIF